MTVSTPVALLIAILLWLSGFVVGGGAATLLTMFYVFGQGLQAAEREKEASTQEE